MERWKQEQIYCIKMLPLNEKSFEFLKELTIRDIKEKKLDIVTENKELKDKNEELEYQLSKEKFKNTTP